MKHCKIGQHWITVAQYSNVLGLIGHSCGMYRTYLQVVMANLLDSVSTPASSSWCWRTRSSGDKLTVAIFWNKCWSTMIASWICRRVKTLFASTMLTTAVSCSAVRSLPLPPRCSNLAVLQKIQIDTNTAWSLQH